MRNQTSRQKTSKSTGLGNFIKDFLLLLPRDHGVQRKDSKPGKAMALGFPKTTQSTQISPSISKPSYLETAKRWSQNNKKNVSSSSASRKVIQAALRPATNQGSFFFLRWQIWHWDIGIPSNNPAIRVTVLFRAEKCCISHLFPCQNVQKWETYLHQVGYLHCTWKFPIAGNSYGKSAFI